MNELRKLVARASGARLTFHLAVLSCLKVPVAV